MFSWMLFWPNIRSINYSLSVFTFFNSCSLSLRKFPSKDPSKRSGQIKFPFEVVTLFDSCDIVSYSSGFPVTPFRGFPKTDSHTTQTSGRIDTFSTVPECQPDKPSCHSVVPLKVQSSVNFGTQVSDVKSSLQLFWSSKETFYYPYLS